MFDTLQPVNGLLAGDKVKPVSLVNCSVAQIVLCTGIIATGLFKGAGNKECIG